MKKNLFLGIMLATVALAASSVQAGLVSITGLGAGGSAGGSHPRTPGERGGIFQVTTSGFSDVYNGSFSTFCIELLDLVNVPASYNGQSNTSSISPNSNPVTNASGPTIVPLASGTAWLYRQFLDNTLAGYDGSNQAADALQEALWAYQSQLPVGGWANYGGTYGTLGLTFYNMAAGASGNYGIRIINLGDTGNGWGNQDLLAPVPVPGAVLLGVLGLGAVGWVKRRFA